MISSKGTTVESNAVETGKRGRETASAHVVVITASDVQPRKSDPLRGEAQGSPSLSALSAGFAATGAPLMRQIVYPTFFLTHS